MWESIPLTACAVPALAPPSSKAAHLIPWRNCFWVVMATSGSSLFPSQPLVARLLPSKSLYLLPSIHQTSGLQVPSPGTMSSSTSGTSRDHRPHQTHTLTTGGRWAQATEGRGLRGRTATRCPKLLGREVRGSRAGGCRMCKTLWSVGKCMEYSGIFAVKSDQNTDANETTKIKWMRVKYWGGCLRHGLRSACLAACNRNSCWQSGIFLYSLLGSWAHKEREGRQNRLCLQCCSRPAAHTGIKAGPAVLWFSDDLPEAHRGQQMTRVTTGKRQPGSLPSQHQEECHALHIENFKKGLLEAFYIL